MYPKEFKETDLGKKPDDIIAYYATISKLDNNTLLIYAQHKDCHKSLHHVLKI